MEDWKIEADIHLSELIKLHHKEEAAKNMGKEKEEEKIAKIT